MPARKIDMHSHWGTQRGYPVQDPEGQALQKSTFNSTARFVSENEMADYFRAQNVTTILDLTFPVFLSVEEMAPHHDYAFEVTRAHGDVIIGNWLHFDPRTGQAGLRELQRCAEVAPGFLGLCVAGAGNVPASDPSYEPYYKLCIEAKLPVLILVGTTAYGAGSRGGGGILLDSAHPRHLDYVAANYPDLTILAGRPRPWQSEMIAVLLHKRNVWYELHGWSPKYHPPELKYEITRRLKDRILFGADYPLISYERLEQDWRAEGYPEETLEKVFHANAEAFFQSIGRAPAGG